MNYVGLISYPFNTKLTSIIQQSSLPPEHLCFYNHKKQSVKEVIIECHTLNMSRFASPRTTEKNSPIPNKHLQVHNETTARNY